MLIATPVQFATGDSPASYYYLQNFLNSLVPIFMFYEYAKKGYLTESRLKIYFFIIYVVTIPKYYLNYSRNLLNDEWGNTEFSNNTAYNFLSLFPLVCFFYKRPIIQYICAGAVLLFIIMAMKRGALVIGVVCLAFFIFQNHRNQFASKKRGLTILLTTTIILLVAYYIQHMLSTSALFVYRLSATLDGDSSGRDILQQIIWNSFLQDGGLFEYIFGYGANATIRFAGNYAHNDWLEVLCNNGIIGVILMTIFYYRLYSAGKILKRKAPFCYTALMMLLILCLSRTFFSMSINNMGLCDKCCMGFLVYKAFALNRMSNYENSIVH